MPSEPSPAKSFSTGRKWGIFLSVVVSIASVAALVVMLNYLGARHFERFDWNPEIRAPLRPQTLGLLRTLTNDVTITVYYDKSDPLYDNVLDLAREYKLHSPHITLHVVDSLVDAADARKVQADYKLGPVDGKNMVIVANGDRHIVIKENVLSAYSVEMKPAPGDRMYLDRHLKAFNGEMYISASILNVCNPNPASAYFLQGHGEHRPDSTERLGGYEKFTDLLAQNNVRSDILNLAGTNDIPTNCNLLVIAGPDNPIPREEVDKIRHYLSRGGRLFALFNFLPVTRKSASGLESLLQEWDITLGNNEIEDSDNASGPSDIFVNNLNPDHPVSFPLLGYRLRMIRPRSVTPPLVNKAAETQNAAKATWLAATGPRAVAVESGSRKPANGAVAVIAAVEKSNVKGAFEGGTTRIIVAGDSSFLANDYLDLEANRGFASLALNWLLDQTRLMAGVGPQKVTPIRLAMTNSQMRHVSWIFLAAMPGAILLLGGLVWVRRRH
jgi:hypothetical protein